MEEKKSFLLFQRILKDFALTYIGHVLHWMSLYKKLVITVIMQFEHFRRIERTGLRKQKSENL